MNVAIIDADLIGRDKHRFPNLVCEKISSYHKQKNDEVILKTDYENLDHYDQVYISKVFTDTPIPDWLNSEEVPKNIQRGGTGFYFDKAPNLPDDIEHSIPDYDLYNQWIKEQISKGVSASQFKEYTDYSIGFTTRGCFRKCPFCVNQKYDRVFLHSPLEEFYDPSRKKICLLDDNILGCPKWKEIFEELIVTGKPFKYKQGMDERLLTDEKCEILFNCKYDGDYTFAFDNISDYDLIHKKLQLIRKYTDKKNIKFYVLVGFESTDIFDVINMWERVALLMKYKCLPYIMRYQNKNETPWKSSKYKGMYITMARWCNQPSFFKKKSFREFCELDQSAIKTDKICSSMKVLLDIEKEYPDVAKKYFDLKYEN